MIVIDDVLPELLSKYVEGASESEPQHLKKQRLAAEEKTPEARMISGAYQGRILSLLSKIIQPRAILELGTYTAYATQCLAEGLHKEGKIYTLEHDLRLKDDIEKNLSESKYKNQIEVIYQDATEFLEKTNLEFDLVFLDANKKKYLEFFNLILPKMKSGGVILADNVLWKGRVMHEKEVQRDNMTAALYNFNRIIKTDNRVEVVMLPIRDGLSLIRKI